MTQAIANQDAIEAWKLAHRLVLDVYKLTATWPREEHQGLILKVRNSSVNISSNIVEGYARQNPEAYLPHLADSRAALEETKYSLLVARDLGYLSEHHYDRLMRDAEHLSSLLSALHGRLTKPQVPAQAMIPEETGGQAAPPVRKKSASAVRQSLTDFVGWLKSGSGSRLRQKKFEEPAVWAEEAPVPSYLDEADEE